VLFTVTMAPGTAQACSPVRPPPHIGRLLSTLVEPSQRYAVVFADSGSGAGPGADIGS
jgi:hypothetical protein